MDRQADLSPWLALNDCAGLGEDEVGRKARVLAAIDADGLATPGGYVLPAVVFWDALESCGVAASARYLAGAALRLDPDHVLGIAATIADGLAAAPLEEIAAPLAAALFDDAGALRLVCRSSAAMEDGRDAAFPGMFLSVLDLCSAEALTRAIAACWRSVFQPMLLRYLLRVRPAAIDFSLALLVQPQVEGDWYGICFSEDPLELGGAMVAQLSDGADKLVNGAAAQLRFAWSDGAWHGEGAQPIGLEGLAAAVALLTERAGGPVDIEFALSGGGPIILQCRPAARPARASGISDTADVLERLEGTACAPGLRIGRGVAGDITLVERIGTQDYSLVLSSRAVVAGADTSPLGHVAILCRELGVPLVAGIGERIRQLAGKRLLVDGSRGEVSLLAYEEASSSDPPISPVADDEAVLGTTELLLRLLARANPGDDPELIAREAVARCCRSLGANRIRLANSSDFPVGLAPLIMSLFEDRAIAHDPVAWLNTVVASAES